MFSWRPFLADQAFKTDSNYSFLYVHHWLHMVNQQVYSQHRTYTALPLLLGSPSGCGMVFSLPSAKLLPLNIFWQCRIFLSLFLQLIQNLRRLLTPLRHPRKGESRKAIEGPSLHLNFLLHKWKHWVKMRTMSPASEMWCPSSLTSVPDCLWMSRKWTV